MAAYWYSPGGSGADLTGIGNAGTHPGRVLHARLLRDAASAQPQLGRTIRPEEAVAGNDHYVVLSDGLWQTTLRRRSRASSAAHSRSTAYPYTVVGVMPPAFTYPADRIDFWMPLSTMGPDAIGRQRGSRFLDVIGRLAPGATIAAGAR